jgi:tetratricopeptide (TPR) repeat protein
MKLAVTFLVALATVRDAHADAKAEAQARVDKAKTLHGEGKLAEALAELKEAYVLDPRPELLFAIGQIHVGLGQCAEAITYYERFLSEKPEPQSASVTEEAIQACKERPDAFKPVPKPEPKPVRPPPKREPPPERPRLLGDQVSNGLILGGTVSLVAASTLYYLARRDRGNADDVTSFEQYADLIDSAKDKRNLAVVFAVVGPVLIGSGVLKLVLRERAYRREYDRWAVTPSPGGGVVSFTRGF